MGTKSRENDPKIMELSLRGLDAQEIAAELSMSDSGVRCAQRRLGIAAVRYPRKPWTPEDAEKFEKLANEGKDAKEIAAEMGRTSDAIGKRLRPWKREHEKAGTIREYKPHKVDESLTPVADMSTIQRNGFSRLLERVYGPGMGAFAGILLAQEALASARIDDEGGICTRVLNDNDR